MGLFTALSKDNKPKTASSLADSVGADGKLTGKSSNTHTTSIRCPVKPVDNGISSYFEAFMCYGCDFGGWA